MAEGVQSDTKEWIRGGVSQTGYTHAPSSHRGGSPTSERGDPLGIRQQVGQEASDNHLVSLVESVSQSVGNNESVSQSFCHSQSVSSAE